MNLDKLSARLSDYFDVGRFDERGGWDFALHADDIANLERVASAEFHAGWNGLLCANDVGQKVDRVYLLVFPSTHLIAHVIESERIRGNPGALIVTHHPCDMETTGRGFVPIPPQQLLALSEGRIGLYVLHAPLDCHSVISTSGSLADGLGLRRVGLFAPYYAGHAGVLVEQEPEQFDDFARRVATLCELAEYDLKQVRFAGRKVSRIAILAGGGDDLDALAEAEAWGADTYLAGHWWTPHPGDWCDQNRESIRQWSRSSEMNLLGASHDGSEMVVFRDQLAPLFNGWGLDVELVRESNHWR